MPPQPSPKLSYSGYREKSAGIVVANYGYCSPIPPDVELAVESNPYRSAPINEPSVFSGGKAGTPVLE